MLKYIEPGDQSILEKSVLNMTYVNVPKIKEIINSEDYFSHAPFGFNKFESKLIKNKVLLKSSLLFDIYEASIKFSLEYSNIYIFHLKFMQMNTLQLKKIIQEIKLVINDTRINFLDKYFLPKLGYMYCDVNQCLSLIYLKGDFNFLNFPIRGPRK